MNVAVEYSKEYSNYLRSLRRFAKKYGKTVEIMGRVKRPTEASIRRLRRERKRVREYYKVVRRGKSRATSRLASTITEAIERGDRAEENARVRLEEIKKLIDEGRGFEWDSARSKSDRGYNPGGDLLVHESSKTLYEIFSDAEQKYSALQIMSKLETEFSGLEEIEDTVHKIIYAVFNSLDSGFAKWAGAGAKAKWVATIRRIKEALK